MEYAEIRFEPSGSATLLVGTKSQGQGHETMYRQIACERLGIAPTELRVVEGDTDAVAYGAGSFGSRSICRASGGTYRRLPAGSLSAASRPAACRACPPEPWRASRKTA